MLERAKLELRWGVEAAYWSKRVHADVWDPLLPAEGGAEDLPGGGADVGRMKEGHWRRSLLVTSSDRDLLSPLLPLPPTLAMLLFMLQKT